MGSGKVGKVASTVGTATGQMGFLGGEGASSRVAPLCSPFWVLGALALRKGSMARAQLDQIARAMTKSLAPSSKNCNLAGCS